ncbi:MAG: hypothetical protein IJV98_04415 [Clostridia bacterium]|nr:hypothetical protein [Clostridia bacterium]
MTIPAIISAFFGVAAIYFALRALLSRMAKRALDAVGAAEGTEETSVFAECETLEYAVRCALLRANGRRRIMIYIPSESKDRDELLDIAARLAARYRNVEYQLT